MAGWRRAAAAVLAALVAAATVEATPMPACGSIGASAGFPVPPRSERSLFYIQRSMNANTIVYEANVAGPARLDAGEPVDVFWLRYNDAGERRELDFVERYFAYGVDVSRVGDGRYELRWRAYAERRARLRVGADGRVEAVIELGGRDVRIDSIFLVLDEGGPWPTVDTIEVVGRDAATGERVHECFEP